MSDAASHVTPGELAVAAAPTAHGVEVLIPHRDDIGRLRGALDSLARQTVTVDVCVIDDASSDGSSEVVRRDYPSVRYLYLEENVGFGRALNAGARSSTADLLIFLNNDTIADERFVEHLLAAREATGAKMLAGCLRLMDGAIDSCGIEMDPSLVSFDALHGQPYEPERMRRLNLLAPCAAAGAYDREAFLEVGGFDEAIFAYLEDVDLGIRLQLAGARCAGVPEAFAWHYHSSYWGSGSPRKNRLMGWSRGYLGWKYRRDLQARDALRGLFVDAAIYTGQLVVDRNAGALQGRVTGWRDRRRRPNPPAHPAFADLPFTRVPVPDALRRRLARRRPHRWTSR